MNCRLYRKYLLIAIIGVGTALQASFLAAQTEPLVYQLSGLVLNKSTGEPVPFTRLRIKNSRRGGVCNNEGFYSIPVLATDTIQFSCIGFKPSTLILSTYLQQYTGASIDNPFIYEVHYLVEDSIVQPPVVITPYNTPEELKTAILNIPVPTQSPAQLARENVSPQLMAYFMNNLPKDGEERINIAQQRYQEMYRTKGLAPMYPIADPVAVYRLVKYLTEKAKVKREKVYDYWPEDR
jgi:hypothetical protein